MEHGNLNWLFEDGRKTKQPSKGQIKQTFAVEEQTHAVISTPTCSHGFNVRHTFLNKLN